MIKKEHLVSDISKLKKVYNQSFPWLVTLAEESENAKYFKDALRSLNFYPGSRKRKVPKKTIGMAVARRILLLIEHDDTFVDEAVYGRASSGADGHLWKKAVPDRPFGK